MTGYNISGNPIELNGTVSSQGSGNTFSLPVQLGSSGGFGSSSSTFTVSGNIVTNTNALSLQATSGTLLVSGVISGSGNLVTGGSSTVALSGDNTYTGKTTVAANTLAVRHDNALGLADNTEASGTEITNSSGEVQLENGVTVTGELLTSSPNTTLNLYSIGTGITNTWAGDVNGGGTAADAHITLRPLSTDNRLVIGGDLLARADTTLRFSAERRSRRRSTMTRNVSDQDCGRSPSSSSPARCASRDNSVTR